MRKLTEKSLSCLEAAGWSEGRRVVTDKYQRSNLKCGFAFNQSAREFLARFGGLTLRFPSSRLPDKDDWCHFDASDAVVNSQPSSVMHNEYVLMKKLTIIGESDRGFLTVVMAEDGSVYASGQGMLWECGDSGTEAINRFCDPQENKIEIPLPKFVMPLAQPGIELSKPAFDALDRKIELSKVSVANTAAEFLAIFEGVSLKFTNKTGVQDSCSFSSVRVNPTVISSLSRAVERELVAIGRLKCSGAVLLMDDSGMVFFAVEELPDAIWLLGLSGADCINNLVEGRLGVRVP